MTLTVSFHRKQQIPVSCLPVESKTCCLGIAKADAASDDYEQDHGCKGYDVSVGFRESFHDSSFLTRGSCTNPSTCGILPQLRVPHNRQKLSVVLNLY